MIPVELYWPREMLEAVFPELYGKPAERAETVKIVEHRGGCTVYHVVFGTERQCRTR